MIIKNMTITNSRGDSITFGRHFRLAKDFDLSGTRASVNYSNTTIDGSSYQNTKLKNKDFDVPFFIYKTSNEPWWIEEKRNLAYKVFNPKANPMRIDIETRAGEEYYIIANLEGVPSFPTGFENNNKQWQKGLLQFSANDPFFYAKNEQKVYIALWRGAFQFPLEIPFDTGIEMGYRSPSLIVNVPNEGQTETGMLIRFKALGTVVNPSLINVNTQDFIKLKTVMSAGDVIEISTFTGNKYIELIRNGIKSDIFNTLDLASEFMQLDIGDNLFRYDADENLDNLEVDIRFRNKLLGV